MVSSDHLAGLCQVNPAQVRKDLGYFGEFGIRGVGYDIKELQRELKSILAINRLWNMGIIGMGNLGTALLKHQNFPARGFHFAAVFDSDPVKIGNTVSHGLIIHDIKTLRKVVEEKEIEIGVITTPSSGAQEVADRLIESGVTAILNFSSARLHVPIKCIVEHIDFSIELDILTYKLRHDMGTGMMT